MLCENIYISRNTTVECLSPLVLTFCLHFNLFSNRKRIKNTDVNTLKEVAKLISSVNLALFLKFI